MQGESKAGHEVIVVTPVVVMTDVVAGCGGPVSVRAPGATEVDAMPVDWKGLLGAVIVVTGVEEATSELALYGRNEIRLCTLSTGIGAFGKSEPAGALETCGVSGRISS